MITLADRRERIRARLFIVFIILCTVLLNLLPSTNPFRYVTYSLPLIAIINFVVAKSKVFDISGLLVYVLYLTAFSISFVWNFNSIYLPYALRDIIIFTITLTPLFFRISFSDNQVSALVLGLIGINIVRAVFFPSLVSESLDLQNSSSPLESVSAVVFATAMLRFVHHRKFPSAAAAAICLVLSFKRNIWGGALCGLGALIAYEVIAVSSPKKALIFRIGLTMAVWSAIAFISLRIMDVMWFLRDHISPWKSILEFTLGRSEIYSVLDAKFGHFDIVDIIFGQGPGSVKDLLEKNVVVGLPHNEFRHFMYDYGVMGLIFYLTWAIYMARQSAVAFALAITVIIATLIDNFFFIYICAAPAMWISLPATFKGRGRQVSSPQRTTAYRQGPTLA